MVLAIAVVDLLLLSIAVPGDKECIFEFHQRAPVNC